MPGIVVHHPVVPELPHCVDIQIHSVPRAGPRGRRGGRIKGVPAVALEVRLNPGVCVSRSHDIAAGHMVVLSSAEPIYDS